MQIAEYPANRLRGRRPKQPDRGLTMTKFDHIDERTATPVGLTQALSATSTPASLWRRAADALARYEYLTAEEIAELIGPREDPDVSACLLTLRTSPAPEVAAPTRPAARALGGIVLIDAARLCQQGLQWFAERGGPVNENAAGTLTGATC